MKNKSLSWLAIVLIIETGLIHFFTSQHAFEHATYLGYLFIFNFLGTLLAAYGIYRRWMWGWVLGFVAAGASLTGYVISRSVGLPVMGVEEWLVPSGLLALMIEVLFILLFLLRPWRFTVAETKASAPALTFGYARFVVVAIMMIAVIGFAAYADNRSMHDEQAHLLSPEEVASQPVISSAELEAQYGLRVAQAAISALDSIVDVRLKVVDPDKAHALLEEHAALFVNDKELVLAPHMHSHGEMKPGQIFVIFFPTKNGLIQEGTEISLVFGDVRFEPVVTK